MTNIENNYLTRKEAINKGLSRYNLSYIQSMEILINNEVKKVYSKKSIEEFLLIKKEIENYNGNKEWIKRSTIMCTKEYSFITRLKEDENIKNLFFKEFILGKKKVDFLKKSFLQDVIDGKYNADRSKRRGSYKKEVITFEEIGKTIKKLSKIKMKIRGNRKYTEEEFMSLSIWNELDLNDLEIYSKRFDSEVVEKILNSKGFFSLYNLNKVSGVSYRTLNQSYIEVKKNKIKIREINFEDRIYLEQEVNILILKNYAKKTIERIDNLSEILDERIKFFNERLNETIKVSKKFLSNELINSRISKRECIRKINAIDDFTSFLDSELNECDNDYLIKLLIEKVKSGYRTIVCKFINYAKKELFTSTLYNKKFGSMLLNEYINKEKIDEDRKFDKYNKDIWIEYHNVLKNIDAHYENAIRDIRYAQTWLYCILNLFLTWRKKDIIYKTPNIYLEEIGIYDFNWFLSENIFDLEIAMSVIGQAKLSLDSIVASKNKGKLSYNIPNSLKIPTAIALIICEIHRRNSKNDSIFEDLINSDLKVNDYKRIFKEKKELYGFSGLKCARSIITYGFSGANKKIGTAKLAYEFGSISRGHHRNKGITNTTSEYLRLTNEESSPSEYIIHILERESFGFMYYKIFENILDKESFENLTQSELTELIKSVKSKISPLTLENITSENLNNNDIIAFNVYEKLFLQSVLSSLDLIKENKYLLTKSIIELYKEKSKNLLGDYPRFEEFLEDRIIKLNNAFDDFIVNNIDIKQVLKNIFEGKNNCYSYGGNCIFDNIEKEKFCPYYIKKIGAMTECLGCDYNLSNLNTIYEVAEKTNNLLTYIEKKEHFSELEKIKNSYLMKKYLYLIIEVLSTFRENRYFEKIINVENIKEKVKKLIYECKLINF